MYSKSCTLNPLKTSLTRLCFRAGQEQENKARRSFEGSFRNLNFSPSINILFNFFFPFIDIRCFFSSLNLHDQYCRTIILLNKFRLFKDGTCVLLLPRIRSAHLRIFGFLKNLANFERFLTRWKKQILAKAIRIQNENWGKGAFFADN